MTDQSTSAMTAAELSALASQCYGGRWQSALARDLSVNVRTVQRWAVDGIGKATTADAVRGFLAERRVTAIPSPDPALTEDERDDACYDALHPTISAVFAAASDQGWHPAEAWMAALAITIDAIRAGASDEVAEIALNEAISALKRS